ncbi:unnamed protein product [Gongylonema pulchrum]|uniref:Secreted protein n=1 Tax=Gongylonema pulchrum TaxID=637853 RepID=A0A183DQU3_9BILA|nr:unnamed protein product [Gongylonema pulchrum]
MLTGTAYPLRILYLRVLVPILSDVIREAETVSEPSTVLMQQSISVIDIQHASFLHSIGHVVAKGPLQVFSARWQTLCSFIFIRRWSSFASVCHIVHFEFSKRLGSDTSDHGLREAPLAAKK